MSRQLFYSRTKSEYRISPAPLNPKYLTGVLRNSNFLVIDEKIRIELLNLLDLD